MVPTVIPRHRVAPLLVGLLLALTLAGCPAPAIADLAAAGGGSSAVDRPPATGSSPARSAVTPRVAADLDGRGPDRAPLGVLVRESPDPVGVWPLRPQPDMIHGFNPPDVRWGRGHRGVDLAGHVGQLVRTALPGTVSFSGRIAGRGVVVVDHGPTRTTYEPVAGSAPVGTPVAAGDPIGRLQLGGSHCFPAACLHWGWRRGDVYLDPLRLVGAVPVRLLPW